MRQLLFVILLFSFNQLPCQCTHPDYDALMMLYENTEGPGWRNNSGWLEGAEGTSCNPCDFQGKAWDGIVCDNDRVRILDFSLVGSSAGNNLIGTLPDLALSELRVLDLSFNQLEGVIKDFTGFPLLEDLNLRHNDFEEEIPDFSNLNQLKTLDLSENALTGSIPRFDNLPLLEALLIEYSRLTEIPVFTNLKNLEVLLLQTNYFNTTLPEQPALVNLKIYDCDVNNFVGSLPDLSHHTKLEFFAISSNISGEMPDLSKLVELKEFDVGYNNISGPLPTFSENLKLKRLFVSGNNFSGEIPDLSHLTKLDDFLASSNAFNGCYPEWLCDVNKVDLKFNDLLPWEGRVDNFCEGMPEYYAPCDNDEDPLTYDTINEDCECVEQACLTEHPDYQMLLDIYFATDGENWKVNEGWVVGAIGNHCDPCNYLGGPWAGIECRNNRVVSIDLDGNPDSGLIGNGGNGLTGTLPELRSSELESLILTSNNLTGELPSTASLPSLKVLAVGFNQLSGSLPDFWFNTALEHLRISGNNFTGTIPAAETFHKLKTFTFSNNDFHGCLPNYLCDLELADANGNPLLPWSGELTEFCEGATQIGAPCISEQGIVGEIDDDCNCVFSTSSDDHFLEEISVYPNPSSSIINIETALDFNAIKIQNILGEIVISLKTKEHRIDISELQPGVYFINVEVDQAQNFISQIVKF